ncbi:hypothetical protein [Tenacibaculum finnmarkense]|nr:hypothetical protein [Tenacibaculum finnmarkense]MCD8401896.1 hypothetical protein [Tenacibaculum finnmarkense genomovar finnmarkense]
MILYKNFKTQKSDYISAKKLWEATLELSIYKAQKTGWINLGASDFDGNPILVYYNHEQKKQIRIIQINEKDAVK